MKNNKVLSLGTMYVDINCTNFPFETGLYQHKETVGSNYSLDLGGSALNFARIAAKLGLDVSFIGKLGKDSMGDILISLLKQNDISPAVIRDKNEQTNLAIHYIHQDGSSIMTSTGTANSSLTIQELEKNLNKVTENINYFYLGGVFKLKKLLPAMPKLFEYLQKKGIKIILDHGRLNNKVTKQDIVFLQKLFPFIDIYLPSEDEFLSLWRSTTIQEGLEKLRETSQAITVIKQAEEGATGFINNKICKVKSYNVKIINTVGAGDSFNAGFIKAYTKGFEFERCIKYACAVSAIKISSDQTFTIDHVNTLFNS